MTFPASNSDCPSSSNNFVASPPSNLICLSTKECNRCRIDGTTHEGCSSTTPVCDMDTTVSNDQNSKRDNPQTSGTRKLAECIACIKSQSTYS